MPSLVKITGQPKPYCLKIDMTMKTLKSFFGLFLVLVSVSVYAQEYPEYIPAPELEAYVGTWKWESGDSVIIVHFEIAKNIYINDIFGFIDASVDSVKGDFLLGWHKVLKGNSVSQNSIAKKDIKSNSFRNSTIQGAYFRDLNSVRLKSFTDLNNNTNPNGGDIKLLDENTMSIQLRMYTQGLHVHFEGEEKPEKKKYQLPLKMILKRVE
jgi:hypothetical protein